MIHLIGTVVDTDALLETSLAALVAGVGVAFTFSLAILGATRLSEASREQRRLQMLAFGAVAIAGLVATAAAIAFGILAMTSK